MRSDLLSVNGGRLHVEQVGDSGHPSVLLVMGNWAAMLDAIERQTKEP